MSVWFYFMPYRLSLTAERWAQDAGRKISDELKAKSAKPKEKIMVADDKN